MKLGLLARTGAVLLATGAFIGACSNDSDQLSLAEYFTEFEAIDADVDSQFEVLFSELPADEDPFADEANLEALKDLAGGFPRIMADATDQADDLNPPSEVEDAHDAMIDAGRTLVAAYGGFVDAVGDAETMAELETLFSEAGTTIDIAEAAFDAACLAIEDIARANDIHISVTCVDE